MATCIWQFVCLAAILPQATCLHGTHSAMVVGPNGPEAVSGEVSAAPDSLLVTDLSLAAEIQRMRNLSEHLSEPPPHRVDSGDHSMLQMSVEVQRETAPPVINFAEVSLQLRSRDGDAVLAIFVMVGVPCLLGIGCLLLAPRDGKSSWSEDPTVQTNPSLRSAAPPLGSAEAMLPGSRAPSVPVLSAGASWDPAAALAKSNMQRSDSMSSAASERPAGLKMNIETGTLCQSLVVPKASGVTLGLDGELLPCQQETMVEITMKDSTSNEGLLRLLVSETGKDSGMLLESVLKLPIAILDTSNAVSRRGLPPPAENRRVLIRRDMDPARAPFAVVRSDGAARVFKATRGTMNGGAGEPLISVLVDMGGLRANIVNAEGRLIASMESRQEPSGKSQRFLNICHGADAALVLCVVFSAIKLG